METKIECYDDLLKIRNLGRKSSDELIEKMRELGFTEWADNMKAGG